ncbi:MAG: hypothetical protein ACJ0Q7_03710 [Pelagibacteraceae bacterium]|nr:MAG: hypothetical protein EVA55_04635 [alpha proteobacterium HIMB114]
MMRFIYNYIASIVLLITVLIGSVNVEILGKQLSYYINLQLILIYLFKITNPNLNFGKGIYLFLISIINDSLNGLFFGTSAILYFIVFGVAAFQSSIKLRSIFLSEWISFGVSLILAYSVFFGLIKLSGEDIILSSISVNFILTLIGYPVFWFSIVNILKNVNR